jgi:hypothetical protein
LSWTFVALKSFRKMQPNLTNMEVIWQSGIGLEVRVATGAGNFRRTAHFGQIWTNPVARGSEPRSIKIARAWEKLAEEAEAES